LTALRTVAPRTPWWRQIWPPTVSRASRSFCSALP
jgi:hypothetical protein